MTNPKGFFVDPKEWTLAPNQIYAENPPDDWEDCDQCGGCHPPDYTGDCRSDINRWPSEKCIAALTTDAQAPINARLMTAAPEMLEALQNIFRALLCPEPKTLKGWAQRNNHIDRIVRSALNKAEGSNL